MTVNRQFIMKHYPIQYLRAIAALLVVFEHFKIYPFNDNLFSGTIGVDMFYIISGFIMSINIDKYVDHKRTFIINRMVRIYPLYLILSFPLVGLYLYNHSIDILTAIPSLYFVGSFSAVSYKDPILYSGWTLFYEFVFYALIITFSSDRRITALVLCIMGLFGLAFTITNPAGYFFNQFYFLFAIGMLLNRAFKSQVLSGFTTELLVVSTVLMLSVMLFNDHARAGDNNYIPRQYLYILNRPIPRVLIWGLPSACFVISFYRFFINRPGIPWLNELGNMSYSIYLVHTFLFQIHNYLISSYGFLNTGMFTFCVILLIYPVSRLTYNLVEVRLGRWLKQQLDDGAGVPV